MMIFLYHLTKYVTYYITNYKFIHYDDHLDLCYIHNFYISLASFFFCFKKEAIKEMIDLKTK
jgi:hypothetical protein